MNAVALPILAAWVCFWAYWLIASIGAKRGRIDWGRTLVLRVGIVAVVFLAVRTRIFKTSSMTITADPWLEGIGLLLVFLGLAVAVWARVLLGRNWGTPMSEKEDPELVTAGPYGVIRHPVYLGLVVAMGGTAMATTLDWLVVAALMGAYFVYSATVEERNMARRFPEEYTRYRRSTKMLIPFVY